jgi:tetraacyldisaccharide-1-P 4'-kinase
LGRPAGFLESLRSQGLTIRLAVTQPDHDPLTDGNLLRGFAGDRLIVVTGKDWVKLRERSDVGSYNIAIANYDIVVEPRDEFRNWLQTKLNGISQKEA